MGYRGGGAWEGHLEVGVFAGFGPRNFESGRMVQWRQGPVSGVISKVLLLLGPKVTLVLS